MRQRCLHREVDNKLDVSALANVVDGFALRAPQFDETAVFLFVRVDGMGGGGG